MQELIEQLREFVRERDWEQFHSPKNLAMALSVETAEIVELFQWLTQDQSRCLTDEKRAAVEDEIADVMIFLTLMADQLSIDPVSAALKKMKQNKEKYPADMVRGKSEKYTAYI